MTGGSPVRSSYLIERLNVKRSLLVDCRDSNAPKTTDRASQPSEASVAEIVRENRRQMAELLNLDDPQAAPTPRNELHPKRSQRRVEVAVV